MTLEDQWKTRGFDEKLFDDIIKESQVVALGEEWKTMDKMMARLFTLDDKAVDLAFSPYVRNSKPPRRKRDET